MGAFKRKHNREVNSWLFNNPGKILIQFTGRGLKHLCFITIEVDFYVKVFFEDKLTIQLITEFLNPVFSQLF